MSRDAIYLCENDGNCPKPGHGKYIYFCRLCHEEWQQKNPNVAALLSRGSTDKSQLAAARKKDKAVQIDEANSS